VIGVEWEGGGREKGAARAILRACSQPLGSLLPSCVAALDRGWGCRTTIVRVTRRGNTSNREASPGAQYPANTVGVR